MFIFRCRALQLNKIQPVPVYTIFTKQIGKHIWWNTSQIVKRESVKNTFLLFTAAERICTLSNTVYALVTSVVLTYFTVVHVTVVKRIRSMYYDELG